MKKVLALLMVAGMFSLVACGPSEEEAAAAAAEAEAAMEEMMSGMEEAVEEVAAEPIAEQQIHRSITTHRRHSRSRRKLGLDGNCTTHKEYSEGQYSRLHGGGLRRKSRNFSA